mgnify:CR=1 FL=1
MITIKTDREIELMYKAGQVAAEALALGGENVKPGVTTKHINDVMERFIKSKGGIPSRATADFPRLHASRSTIRSYMGFRPQTELLQMGIS